MAQISAENFSSSSCTCLTISAFNAASSALLIWYRCKAFIALWSPPFLVAVFGRASAWEARIIAIAAYAVSVSARTYPAPVYAASAARPPICPRKYYVVRLFNACCAKFTYVHCFCAHLPLSSPRHLVYPTTTAYRSLHSRSARHLCKQNRLRRRTQSS